MLVAVDLFIWNSSKLGRVLQVAKVYKWLWISWNKIIENVCNLSLGFATSSLPLKVGMQQGCFLCFKRKKEIKKWTNLSYLLKGLLYIWASECTLWFGSVLEPGCAQLAFVSAWTICYSESRIDPCIEQIKGSVT